jgi:hypothetical protein
MHLEFLDYCFCLDLPVHATRSCQIQFFQESAGGLPEGFVMAVDDEDLSTAFRDPMSS